MVKIREKYEEITGSICEIDGVECFYDADEDKVILEYDGTRYTITPDKVTPYHEVMDEGRHYGNIERISGWMITHLDNVEILEIHHIMSEGGVY